MRRYAYVLPLLLLSACGSCADDVDGTDKQNSAVTTPAREGGLRFATPFRPGAADKTRVADVDAN